MDENTFVVDNEQGKLHYFITVTDPWVVTEPFEKELLWIWTPGVKVGSYNCAVEDEPAVLPGLRLIRDTTEAASRITRTVVMTTIRSIVNRSQFSMS